MRPNLFNYATSELSQDAFICWLAAWADQTYTHQDERLHQLGRQFITSLIQKHQPNYSANTIRTIEVRKQVGKLDIRIEVNRGNEDQLVILIEDKTHTDHHSDQLKRYYDDILAEKNDFEKHIYSESQIIPIYLKTGYQSKFDVERFGYKTYLRKEFLQLLESEKHSVKHDVYQDFLAYLGNMEQVVNKFSNQTIQAWDGNDWRGFFIWLYDNRIKPHRDLDNDEANWGYVPNASGGFFGYWWYFKRNYTEHHGYTPYLQLEQDKLCFKIEVPTQTNRTSARNDALEKLWEVDTSSNLQRPKRMGSGHYMTVMLWNGDYRVANEDGTINKDATLQNLKKAQNIVNEAFSDE